MAKKEDGKLHIKIDQIENGFEVSCCRDKKPKSISERAGWVPTMYEEPKKHAFPTLEKAWQHIKEEADCK